MDSRKRLSLLSEGIVATKEENFKLKFFLQKQALLSWLTDDITSACHCHICQEGLAIVRRKCYTTSSCFAEITVATGIWLVRDSVIPYKVLTVVGSRWRFITSFAGDLEKICTFSKLYPNRNVKLVLIYPFVRKNNYPQFYPLDPIYIATTNFMSH